MFSFRSTCTVAMAALAICGFSHCAMADPGQLTVNVGNPGVKISPMLYGLMTEEINHAYDGGLYAELIQNRIFKDKGTNPVHWSAVTGTGANATIAIVQTDPVTPALSNSLELTISSASPTARAGISNDGFWGIGVFPSTKYHASFYAKSSNGFSGPLTVDIEAADGGKVFAKGVVPAITSTWKQYSVDLKTPAGITPSASNLFVVSGNSPGTVDFSLVSLFPPTYHNTVNGNRIDLMEKLAEMHPAFLRLPGGNYLDPGHYIWKENVGPLQDRPGGAGAWGYRVSNGLGILEFFKWCEDLHMGSVLAVSDGRAWLPADGDVGPLVQDALDELEYVTGPATSTWGAKRAADGHPAPFKVDYVEVGNEDFFDKASVYSARFTKFYGAIKAKYPNMPIIATRWGTETKPDLVDDHYYRSAEAMEKDSTHYDSTDRTGPKVFVGEWASTEGSPTPTMQAALGDASWLTGLERNSDVVQISSYAPLFVNVNRGARQWGTNLIGYDALSSFGSPSFYAQAMFGANRGDVVLPVQIAAPSDTASAAVPVDKGAVGVGTWLTQAEFRNIKVTNGDTVLYQKDFATDDADWQTTGGQWSVQNGSLSQTSNDENCRAYSGSPNWTDYTYTLQAKKDSGAEGFLIMFHVKDADNYLWWNVGGWGNTRSAIEKVGADKHDLGPSENVTIDTGKWYDVKIEVQGPVIRCYLDGKLIETATDTPGASGAGPIYSTASRDNATGDVIVKAVNVTGTDEDMNVNLSGLARVGKSATCIQLSGQPGDVNSIDDPKKVYPVTKTIPITGPTFEHVFPAYSVTVLRIRTK
jgi:alpha-L-arabinofuranosidase